MSIETVKTVATRFLMKETPEVLSLKGAWGVGKTHLWHELVEQNKNQIKLEKYCYVSLFGISSLKELRMTIFAKTQSVDSIGKKSGFNSFEIKALGNLIKGKLSDISKLPSLKNNVSVGLELIAPYFIKDTIICFDDFERMGTDGIKPDELLGLISELKEERDCKVALIFNADELKQREVYEKYREKVIDVELLYSPTVEEAIEIALPDDLPSRELVKKYSASLDITNIRVLKRIADFTKLIHCEVKNLHPHVMAQAVNTLVLLTYCYYSSNEKTPTLDFVKKWDYVRWEHKKLKIESGEEDVNTKHIEWSKLLQEYDLADMDEFDLSLSAAIEHGYLEESGIPSTAEKLDQKFKANDLEQSFSDAWYLFHDSFNNNEKELVESLTNSLKASAIHISPLNLHSTVRMLRELNHDTEANELIDHYISANSDNKNLFNLAENPFSSEITDEMILDRFGEKHLESFPNLSLADAIKNIESRKATPADYFPILEKATEEDFYSLFKDDHGRNLHHIVNVCLNLGNTKGLSHVSEKVRNTLIKIGKENRLNAIRVNRYGITLEEK